MLKVTSILVLYFESCFAEMVSGANFLMVNKWIFKKWSYGNILKMKPSMQ